MLPKFQRPRPPGGSRWPSGRSAPGRPRVEPTDKIPPPRHKPAWRHPGARPPQTPRRPLNQRPERLRPSETASPPGPLPGPPREARGGSCRPFPEPEPTGPARRERPELHRPAAGTRRWFPRPGRRGRGAGPRPGPGRGPKRSRRSAPSGAGPRPNRPGRSVPGPSVSGFRRRRYPDRSGKRELLRRRGTRRGAGPVEGRR